MNPLRGQQTPISSDLGTAGEGACQGVDVSRCIRVDPLEVAPILLAISPCRSGSTVMLRVFGHSGVQSHFQELKNILRWRMQGQDRLWTVPKGPGLVFLKETLGPYCDAESLFDPMRTLLDAGYPKERLRLLIMGREPMQTWASWYAIWRGLVNVQCCITAYQTTDRIGKEARALGIGTTYLVYEAFRDYPAESVIRRLMDCLQIAFRFSAIASWEQLPDYGARGSNIRHPEEPTPFISIGAHEQAIRATGLQYSCRNADPPAIRVEDQSEIRDSDLFEIYSGWRSATEAFLGS